MEQKKTCDAPTNIWFHPATLYLTVTLHHNNEAIIEAWSTIYCTVGSSQGPTDTVWTLCSIYKHVSGASHREIISLHWNSLCHRLMIKQLSILAKCRFHSQYTMCEKLNDSYSNTMVGCSLQSHQWMWINDSCLFIITIWSLSWMPPLINHWLIESSRYVQLL